MKELTIEITNYCDHNCTFCSSNANAVGKPLEIAKIYKFLNDNIPFGLKVDRINISGGEPLSHPKFYEILKMCENMAIEVWVYSNAIKNLAYNASVIDGVKVIANVPLAPDTTIHLPKEGEVHLLKFIPQGRGHDIKPLKVKPSCNLVDEKQCAECGHIVLRSDGVTVKHPCKKEVEL
jgi:organic radical activating enzyme